MLATNPETAIEVEKLAAVLRDLAPREVVTYDTLSKAVGYPVQRRRLALIKARDLVEAESGMRFTTVHATGVKKLGAEELPGIGAVARATIARKAKRQAKRLTGLRYNDVDRARQVRIDAERSLLGAISATARTRPEKVEPHVSTGPTVAARVFEVVGAKK